MANSLPLLLLLLSVSGVRSVTLRLDIHHRFSAPVKRWVESSGRDLPGGWPERGSVEYFAALVGHDRGLALANAAPAITFTEGNATLKVSSLGFLYYAMVSVGTPSVTFMVALHRERSVLGALRLLQLRTRHLDRLRIRNASKFGWIMNLSFN